MSTTTTVVTDGTQQSLTLAGLGACKRFDVVNQGPSGPITLGYWREAAGPNGGVQIGVPGSGWNALTVAPGFTSLPMPSCDVISLWSAIPGQSVQFTWA